MGAKCTAILAVLSLVILESCPADSDPGPLRQLLHAASHTDRFHPYPSIKDCRSIIATLGLSWDVQEMFRGSPRTSVVSSPHDEYFLLAHASGYLFVGMPMGGPMSDLFRDGSSRPTSTIRLYDLEAILFPQ